MPVPSMKPRKKPANKRCKDGYPCKTTCISRKKNCKSPLNWQATTFLLWEKAQQERLALTNKKRERAGLTPAQLNDSKYITAERTRLPQSATTKVETAIASPVQEEMSEWRAARIKLGEVTRELDALRKEWVIGKGTTKGYESLKEGDRGYLLTGGEYKPHVITAIQKGLGVGSTSRSLTHALPTGVVSVGEINSIEHGQIYKNERNAHLSHVLSPDTPASVLKKMAALGKERKALSDLEDDLYEKRNNPQSETTKAIAAPVPTALSGEPKSIRMRRKEKEIEIETLANEWSIAKNGDYKSVKEGDRGYVISGGEYKPHTIVTIQKALGAGSTSRSLTHLTPTGRAFVGEISWIDAESQLYKTPTDRTIKSILRADTPVEVIKKLNKLKKEYRELSDLEDDISEKRNNPQSETAKIETAIASPVSNKTAIASQKGKQPPAEIVEKMNLALQPLQEFNRLVEAARQTGKVGGGGSDRYIWDLGDKLLAQMNQFEGNRKAWEEAYSLGVKNGFDMSAFNLPATVPLTKSEAKALKERWDGLGVTRQAASPTPSKPTATTREQLIAEENRLGKELDAILNKYPGRRTPEQQAEINTKEKEYFAANRALRDFNGGKSVESPVIAEAKPIEAKTEAAIAEQTPFNPFVESKSTEVVERGLVIKVGTKEVNLPKPLDKYTGLKISHDPSLGWQILDADNDALRRPQKGGNVYSHRFKERSQAENFAKAVLAKVDRAIAKQEKVTSNVPQLLSHALGGGVIQATSLKGEPFEITYHRKNKDKFERAHVAMKNLATGEVKQVSMTQVGFRNYLENLGNDANPKMIAKQQKSAKPEPTKATQSQKEEKAIAALEDLAKIRIDDTPKTTGGNGDRVSESKPLLKFATDGSGSLSYESAIAAPRGKNEAQGQANTAKLLGEQKAISPKAIYEWAQKQDVNLTSLFNRHGQKINDPRSDENGAFLTAITGGISFDKALSNVKLRASESPKTGSGDRKVFTPKYVHGRIRTGTQRPDRILSKIEDLTGLEHASGGFGEDNGHYRNFTFENTPENLTKFRAAGGTIKKEQDQALRREDRESTSNEDREAHYKAGIKDMTVSQWVAAGRPDAKTDGADVFAELGKKNDKMKVIGQVLSQASFSSPVTTAKIDLIKKDKDDAEKIMDQIQSWIDLNSNTYGYSVAGVKKAIEDVLIMVKDPTKPTPDNQPDLFNPPKPKENPITVPKAAPLTPREKAIAAKIDMEQRKGKHGKGFTDTAKAYIAESLLAQKDSLAQPTKPLIFNGFKVAGMPLSLIDGAAQLIKEGNGYNLRDTFKKASAPRKASPDYAKDVAKNSAIDLLKKIGFLRGDRGSYYPTDEGRVFLEKHTPSESMVNTEKEFISINLPGATEFNIRNTPEAIETFLKKVNIKPDELEKWADRLKTLSFAEKRAITRFEILKLKGLARHINYAYQAA